MRARDFLKEATAPTQPQTASPAGSFTVDVPKGNRGTEVVDLQKALVALGYQLPKFGIDGIRGSETSGAIRRFQKDNQLSVDGIPGENTISKLNAILAAKPEIASTLKKSVPSEVKSKGPAVTKAGNAKSTAGDGVPGNGDAIEALMFFINKGWTGAQAAGLVGNLQAESGVNLKINAVGDKDKNGVYKAYGIAQWHPPRQEHFAKVFGKDIRESSFKEQLEFIDWELNNTEAKAGNLLKGAKTPEEAAAIVDQHYERSSGAHRQRRIEYALALSSKVPATA